MARFKRILLKLSGESLMGEKQYGIDEKRLNEYAQQIKEIHELGVQIGIVIGGGNIFRGLSGASKGFDRVKGDQMGMLATVINSLGLSSALGAAGVKARVLTAIRMEPIGEFYSKWKAIEAMENGEVVIMSAGTGNPFFTTDTGSSLRGIEIEADVMLKGTRVDGIYTADPEKDPTATKFHDITYDKDIVDKYLARPDFYRLNISLENDCNGTSSDAYLQLTFSLKHIEFSGGYNFANLFSAEYRKDTGWFVVSGEGEVLMGAKK